MPSQFYLFFIVIVFVLGLGVYLILKKLENLKGDKKDDETLVAWLKSNQELLQRSNAEINRTLRGNTDVISQRLDKAAQVIGDLQREAGQFSEIGRSMKELQEFLRSPNLRGNIGEEVLKDLINQMFPKSSFFLQHTFKSGEKVDAALKTDAGLLPIDSKFPLENFQRILKAENKEEEKRARSAFVSDVKKHIKAISQKYILPEEGTMDFALMYIPSEAVFYEIVNLTELTDFAKGQRVYPVSPSTLYAHLQTILLSFEGKKMEGKAKEVLQLLRALQKDYEKTEGAINVLGKHLQNAYNQMNHVVSGFNLLGQKLSSVQNLSPGEEKKKLSS